MAYVGSHFYYAADTFCLAAMSREGILGPAIRFYNEWSCRLGANAIDLAFHQFGENVFLWAPILILTAWITSLTLTIRKFNLWASFRFIPIAISFVIIFSTLTICHQIDQSLYWPENMSCVLPPLVFESLIVYLAIKAKHTTNKPFAYFSLFIISFLSGLFHEVYTVVQISLLCLTIFLFRKKLHNHQLIPILITVLLASIASFLILYLSPGLAVRQEAVNAHHDLFKILYGAQKDFFHLLRRSIIHENSLSILCVVGTTFLAGFTVKDKISISFFLSKSSIAILGSLAIFIAFAVGRYALDDALPSRTWVLPVHFLVLTLGLIFFQFGYEKKNIHHVFKTLGPLVIILVSMASSYFESKKELARLPDYRLYRERIKEMDRRVIELQNAGQKVITYPFFSNPYGLGNPGTIEDQNFVNACLDKYYPGIKVYFSNQENN